MEKDLQHYFKKYVNNLEFKLKKLRDFLKIKIIFLDTKYKGIIMSGIVYVLKMNGTYLIYL